MTDAASPASLADVACLEAFYESQVCGGLPLQDMIQKVLLDTLGLGIQEVLVLLHRQRPTFAEFQHWILETAGPPDPDLLSRYHGWLFETAPTQAALADLAAIEAMAPVLDAAAMAHWDEHGYVVLPQTISAEEAAAVRALIWTEVGATPGDSASWHKPRPDGIMIARYHHPSLAAARTSPRIRKAFAQLWGTANLWLTIDRLGFNAPHSAEHPFQGSDLHWDVSLTRPIPFGTQAVLYLSDTEADQGAFRCVPGFHRRIDPWLADPANGSPRNVDMSAEQVFVPGRAGDLVIWRQDLPHGASPNRGKAPRLVQYLNYYSPEMPIRRWQ